MTARIVVVGSLNMDLVVSAPRFPAPGETLLGSSFATHPGGKGANQAVAAARLTEAARDAVALVGRVGDDQHGRTLLDALRCERVNLEGVEIDPSVPTGVAVITVSDGGENQIVVAPGANGAVGAAQVERAGQRIAAAAVVVAQLEIPPEAVAAGARLARRAGVRFVLNAAPAQTLPPDLLAGVDVLVVNAGEAAALLGGANGEPASLAVELLGRGPRAVALTLGAQGALWVDADGPLAVAAPRVDACDTTAAGDAYVGALACSLARGRPPAEALRYACTAGSLAATRAGAIPSLPRADEIEKALSRCPPAVRPASWDAPSGTGP